MKRTILSVFLALILITGLAFTQAPYKLPPKEVVDIVMAPLPPRSSISPDGETMLLVEYEAMPSIAYMALPLHRIAGIRILPKYNARQTTTFYTKITIQKIKEATATEVLLPDGAEIGFPRWSYDSKWFAFLMYGDKGVELWAAEAKTGKAKALTGEIINATLNFGFALLPDKRHILAFTTLEDRGAPPPEPDVPKGPNIQETSGKYAKVWTYQDLLQSAYDESLFDYFTTYQIIEIDVENGNTKKIGSPGIYLYAEPSPDGKLLLVYKIKRPYSYMVPYFRFPHCLEIWNRNGEVVHTLAHLPLADEVPMRGVAKGVRDIEWRALKPATLIWVEALDEGDPEKEVPYRDKLMTLSAPFKEEPQEVMKIEHRYAGISWLQSKGSGFLTEYDWKRRWRTTYLVDVDDPSIPPQKIVDLSIHDRYNDPGRPVYKITSEGEAVIMQDKDWIYLSGSGASPQGDRPFLDKMNLKTMESERLFQCGENRYERFIDFVGNNKNQIIIQSESKTEPLLLLDSKTSAVLYGKILKSILKFLPSCMPIILTNPSSLSTAKRITILEIFRFSHNDSIMRSKVMELQLDWSCFRTKAMAIEPKNPCFTCWLR